MYKLHLILNLCKLLKAERLHEKAFARLLDSQLKKSGVDKSFQIEQKLGRRAHDIRKEFNKLAGKTDIGTGSHGESIEEAQNVYTDSLKDWKSYKDKNRDSPDKIIEARKGIGDGAEAYRNFRIGESYRQNTPQ